MQIQGHWLSDVTRIVSPNFNDRPSEDDISLIVIHCISLPPNEFGANYIDDLFCNRLNPSLHPYFEAIATLKVSAHLLIQRDGECVQYVPFHKRAWHAGTSQFFGREKCNDFSIGIELEGDGDVFFTNEQYVSLAEMIGVLLKKFPDLRFAGHSDIAPERKTDPGPSFDWARLTKIAKLSEERLPFGDSSR